jgi:hypothetical protein
VQRRIELKPSLSVASKRTAPQWHRPARMFVSLTMLPVLIEIDFNAKRISGM